MLTPKQRLAAQKLYSQSVGTNEERALIMRLRKHEDHQQVSMLTALLQVIKNKCMEDK